MATDNKQKVLIRSMSYDELENYLVNSDLNSKIIPKNEDTWHQNYDAIGYKAGCILTNNTNNNNKKIFLKRYVNTINSSYTSNYHDSIKTNICYYGIPGQAVSEKFIETCFRPLIEYKE